MSVPEGHLPLGESPNVTTGRLDGSSCAFSSELREVRDCTNQTVLPSGMGGVRNEPVQLSDFGAVVSGLRITLCEEKYLRR